MTVRAPAVAIATISLVLGGAFAAAVPPLQAPDERDRAFREAAQPAEIVATFSAMLDPPAPALVALHASAVEAELGGRRQEAIASYRRILETAPDAPLVSRALAALLLEQPQASPGERTEIERLARRASRESRFEDPLDLAVLSSALRLEGRMREAHAVGRQAVEQANAGGDGGLAIELERTLLPGPQRP